MMRLLTLARALMCIVFLSVPLLPAEAAAAQSPAEASPGASGVPLEPPEVFDVTFTGGGALVAHSDYIRLTYVSATGETVASDEFVVSAPANVLAVVHSPPTVPGAIGFNVYAVQNNGGSGTGETLQNLAPLAFGKDYEEPVTGWSTTGREPPTQNTALVPISNAPPAPLVTQKLTATGLSRAGGYVRVPLKRSADQVLKSALAMLMPLNDAPPGTSISVAGFIGSAHFTQRPPSMSLAPGKVIETIDFQVSNTVTFRSVPTFKRRTLTVGDANAPSAVEFYDGTTRALLAIMPADARSNFVYFPDFNTPFKAVKNRTYYAEFVSGAHYDTRVTVRKVAGTYALPDVANIHASVDMPASLNDVEITTLAATVAPVGLPPLHVPGLIRVPYYLSAVVSGTGTFSGTALLHITLPPDAAPTESFSLAAYDSGFFSKGWFVGIKPTSIVGSTLSFRLSLPEFIAWRQYGFALYSTNGQAATTDTGTYAGSASSADIVVVGDSLSRLAILPPSTPNCVAGYGPLPECQFTVDSHLNWPGALTKLTGYSVLNLASLGAMTTENAFFGPSMLELQVPQIPVATKVVVVDWGDADVGMSGGATKTAARAEIMTKAILARAPQAHIVYIGIHCAPECHKDAVNAWNDADRLLAKQYGAYIDPLLLGPDGANTAYLDGGHLSLDAARVLATKVAEDIAAWGMTNRATVK